MQERGTGYHAGRQQGEFCRVSQDRLNAACMMHVGSKPADPRRKEACYGVTGALPGKPTRAWTRAGGAAVMNRQDRAQSHKDEFTQPAVSQWWPEGKAEATEGSTQSVSAGQGSSGRTGSLGRVDVGCTQRAGGCVAPDFPRELKGQERGRCGNPLNQDDS